MRLLNSPVLILSLLQTGFCYCPMSRKDRCFTTACTIPVPMDSDFEKECQQHGTHSLCDLHSVLDRGAYSGIEMAAVQLNVIFGNSGTSSVAVVVVKRLDLPILSSRDLHHDFECLFANFTKRIHQAGFQSHRDYANFLLASADALRKRYFLTDCYNNLLVLATEGFRITENPKIIPKSPSVAISTSPPLRQVFGRKFLRHIHKSAEHDLLSRRRIGETISTALRVMNRKYQTMENRVPRKVHFIPQWAIITFGVALLIVAGCLVVEWVILSSQPKILTTKKTPAPSEPDSSKGFKGGGLLAVMSKKREIVGIPEKI